MLVYLFYLCFLKSANHLTKVSPVLVNLNRFMDLMKKIMSKAVSLRVTSQVVQIPLTLFIPNHLVSVNIYTTFKMSKTLNSHDCNLCPKF